MDRSGEVARYSLVAHVCTVWPLYVVGSGNHYPTDYKGAFPWGRQLICAGGRLDSSQNQVADVEIVLVDVAIMIAPELLLISRVLYGGCQTVLLCRVDVGASSRLGFVFVVVLDAQRTKSYV